MSNRDFKNTSRSGSKGRGQTSSKSSGKGGGVMAGVLVGLIIGVAVVVGAVMYFNRATTPFTNLQKIERRGQPASTAATEVLAPEVGNRLSDQKPGMQSQTQVPAPLPDASSAGVPPGAPATKPSSSQKAQKSDSAKQDQQEFDFYKILPGKLDAVPGDDSAVKAPPAAPAGKRTYLQVGAFQHESEADNLKAKLALLGVEANIQSVNVPDKGLLHRVRVGPFSRPDELERVRNQLKQNGIEASVVKSDNS
jgi:cell division protein FtsN